MTAWQVGPPGAEDESRWRQLYAGYLQFYGRPVTGAHLDLVWSWLHDPVHVLRGLLVRDGSAPAAGLAHLRPYPRPLLAGTGCFLDDLFVDPAARGGGAATALLHGVRQVATDEGWGAVRWITSEDNLRARATYDRVASATSLVTYEMPAQDE
ncbi:GNAT family N-acetyltransferase [Phycicoccus flavus]|uniref:GNAT family N-acetyltransferase n=1 Tax=Phycicoccus flavus TaxID=2502783 RepID=UPI000FEBDDE2|nr:GNAT family N-acetyltransferase [Phycicoccus flavus]NHA68859.1 GNAT family N-acetyltransferase [Phycicoccus flavus]